MQRCSFFIEGKALFGSFPTQEQVTALEEMGVRSFFDLTSKEETKITPYTTKYKYVRYPIQDRKTPRDWVSFARLIVDICKDIKSLGEGEKVYIHCKGGHGRSGVIVACVLCHYLGIKPEEALELTNKYHADRPEMRDKWRKIGSPQGKRQKDFVCKFFKPIYYHGNHEQDYSYGFGNASNHSIELPGVGVFKNAYLAYHALVYQDDKEYIKKLLEGIHERKDKHNHDYEAMKKVIELKFRQHPELKQKLLQTGLRPLYKSSVNTYWGSEKNMHGKILTELRVVFLDERE
jgi:predicted NAD-dependent protein-ADP-ribosyltransferase YbiA (DUF1768 family)